MCEMAKCAKCAKLINWTAVGYFQGLHSSFVTGKYIAFTLDLVHLGENESLQIVWEIKLHSACVLS